jgi:hypothetical protein
MRIETGKAPLCKGRPERAAEKAVYGVDWKRS